MRIPGALEHLRHQPDGADWLARLPRLVDELAGLWGIQPGEAREDANVSFVAPTLLDGRRVVLKIQWPHPECAFEADALREWAGEGAVRLIRHDRERHALLLEHCWPGTHLSRAGIVDGLGVFVELLPRLWKPAGMPFRSLADQAADWLGSLASDWQAAGRPCDRYLVDAAADYLAFLAPTQGEHVLVHQDLHGDNVLSAEREPWLAIDPKPLAGERAFSLAPIVRSFEFGHTRAQVLYRLDRLSAELAVDRERARGWTVAQTVAWSFDSAYSQRHFETARWLLAAAPRA